jgi:hypothetical protein
MVDENKNTVDASEVKPNITVEFGEPDMDRILLNAYRDLAAADESGDDGAKLQAYRKLQKLLIDQETIPEKALIYAESGAAGANKGILNTLGFPVDVANLLLGLGETGVRKILNEVGFDMPATLADSKLMSDKPFLGSQSLNEMFNKIGINTEYDKTRASTAIIGRITEEVGMSLPIGAAVASRAQKPMQFFSKEMGVATTAGFGAAQAQQMFPNNVGAEITGQFIGGFTPISLVSTLNLVSKKTGVKEAFNLVYDPRKREKEIAGNILYQKLGKEKTAELVEEIKTGEFTLFGETIDSSKFPRLLNEITNEPELAVLLKQLENSDVGMSLINNIEGSKLVRLLELENNFLKVAKEGNFNITNVVDGVDTQVNIINKYMTSRIALAENTAADKIQALGGNVSIEGASALLRREIDDALSDIYKMEKEMWSKIDGTVDGTIIENGAAAILNNFNKTTDSKNIPKVLIDIVGEQKLIDAGIITPPKNATEIVSNPVFESSVSPKTSIMTEKESVGEILNLRNRIYDEIRLENSKSMPSKEKLQSLDEMLGVIDSAFMDMGTAANINDLTNAISYSDKIRTNFFESEIGSILGYNNKGKLSVIPEMTYNKLVNKGNATDGVATRDVNKVLQQNSEGIQEGLKAEFAQLADPETGTISVNVLNKFLQNKKQILNEFPDLKAQFEDVDEALKIVQNQKTKGQNINRLATEKYVLETMANSGGQSLSSKAIVNGIFNSKNPSREIGKLKNVALKDKSGAAFKGLQNEVADYLMDTIKTKKVVIDGKTTFVPDTKKLDSFINKNKDALVEIYGEGGFKNIEEFQRVLTQIDGALTSGGVEQLQVLANRNVFIASVGRIAGTKVAALTGGPALVFAGIGGNIANKLVANRSGKEIRALLANAFVDPEFARTLLLPYVDNNVDTVSKAIDSYLINAFGVGTRDIQEEVTEERQEELPAEVPVSSIVPESRLNTSMINPVSMRGTPTMDIGAINPNTMARGQQLFGGPGEITFAAKGGIMNTKKAFQRVA